ncbi:hypothetical protein [Sphingomonas sp. R86521]|uniref:hypothetical protein n=1 Tax=Sphingomonas sp. R86521 TaxID=3093860 RepID=UPI0036D24E89
MLKGHWRHEGRALRCGSRPVTRVARFALMIVALENLMHWLLALAMASFPAIVDAAPLHDSIPKEFQGTFAPTAAGCRSSDGVEAIVVAADAIHYYEGDDYLLIGIQFGGSSTKSHNQVPLFNGRFTGRMETQLLGEVNARMEMETPDTLIRYAIKDDGEVDPAPVNTWIRCPGTK